MNKDHLTPIRKELERALQDANETDIHAVSDELLADAAASIGLIINRDAQSASPELNEDALKNHPFLVGIKALISGIERASVDYKLLKIHELNLKIHELEIRRQEMLALEQLANSDASNATAVREVLEATVDVHLEIRSLAYSLDHHIRRIHPDNSNGSNHD